MEASTGTVRNWLLRQTGPQGYMSSKRGGSYPGLEIIGKLSTVLEIEPAELLKLPSKKRARR
jgi:hypothetical protein